MSVFKRKRRNLTDINSGLTSLGCRDQAKRRISKTRLTEAGHYKKFLRGALDALPPPEAPKFEVAAGDLLEFLKVCAATAKPVAAIATRSNVFKDSPAKIFFRIPTLTATSRLVRSPTFTPKLSKN